MNESRKGLRRRIFLIFLAVLVVSFAAILGSLRRLTFVRQERLRPIDSTAYRFTFEIPNLVPAEAGGKGWLPRINRWAEDEFYYVLESGRRLRPKGAEVFSYNAATNAILDLQVQKPLSGAWRFEVDRTIHTTWALPFHAIFFPTRRVIWTTELFTNEVRPPDFFPGAPNSPFE